MRNMHQTYCYLLLAFCLSQAMCAKVGCVIPATAIGVPAGDAVMKTVTSFDFTAFNSTCILTNVCLQTLCDYEDLVNQMTTGVYKDTVPDWTDIGYSRMVFINIVLSYIEHLTLLS